MDLIDQFENNASYNTRKENTDVFMYGNLVELPKDVDIWSFVHHFVSKMSSLYCNQTAEVSQMFAKSLEEEIRKFERKQSTNTLFVEVCHSRPFESEEETELRIVLCLSSVCEEIVHLFYSICKVHENEIVQFLQRCYTNTTNRRLTRSKKKTLCDKHCNLN